MNVVECLNVGFFVFPLALGHLYTSPAGGEYCLLGGRDVITDASVMKWGAGRLFYLCSGIFTLT